MELLRDYRLGSEAAFAALVQRHINLVYSAALRHVGIAAQAEEITQAVFVILARKGASLRPGMVLEAWLYQTTRLTSLSFLRGERRRQAREQEAYMQSTLSESTGDSTWNQIAPLLDDAVARLGKKDREAVVLRFFKEKNLREVATAMNVSESAAQSRVHRALDKLRHYFSKRGVDSTTVMIGSEISAHSVHAAPAALAKSVTAVAVAKGAAASTSTLTLIKGAMKLMAWTKAKSIIVAGVTAILVAGTTAVTVETVKHYAAPPVESYFKALSTKALDAAPPLLVLRPSRYADLGDFAIAGSHFSPDGRIMLRGATFEEVLATAYLTSPEQMVLPPNLPPGNFDLILTLPQNSREALQAEIKKQFGLAGRLETQDTDVFVLKAVQTSAPGLKISHSRGQQIDVEDGRFRLNGYRISDSSQYDLVHLLAKAYGRPVIDETGLTNAYDIDLRWDSTLSKDAQLQEIQTQMRERLGLELVPDRRPIAMLVVEKEN
jgi:uncharacterized protein (TIGR03435 family)